MMLRRATRLFLPRHRRIVSVHRRVQRAKAPRAAGGGGVSAAN